jgi:hypothetical protein
MTILNLTKLLPPVLNQNQPFIAARFFPMIAAREANVISEAR